MTSPVPAAEFCERLFRKLLEDLLEAYHRTPPSVSSRPYIERALRLAQAGYSYSKSLARGAEGLNPSGGGESSAAEAPREV